MKKTNRNISRIQFNICQNCWHHILHCASVENAPNEQVGDYTSRFCIWSGFPIAASLSTLHRSRIPSFNTFQLDCRQPGTTCGSSSLNNMLKHVVRKARTLGLERGCFCLFLLQTQNTQQIHVGQPAML